jgi:RHS repeat-associated protein
MNPASKSSFPAVLDPVVAAVMAQLEEQVEAKNRVISAKDQIIAQSELNIQKLEEALRLERFRKYGSRSEKLSDLQLKLLDLEPAVSNDEIETEISSGPLPEAARRRKRKSHTDSVMGSWSFGYDSLNRLTSTQNTAVTGVSGSYADLYGCWTYDAFGNRLLEAYSTASTTPCTTGANDNAQSTSTPQSASYNNRLSTRTHDAAGNVTYDLVNGNSYLYDAEGRLCAMASGAITGSYTQYVYDAEERRVAKGTITKWSCDPGVNGFTTTNDYVLGPSGEQVTEMSVSGGTSTWSHTNVWAGGKLLVTYDMTGKGLHFYLDDPLGTRRVQTDELGVVEQTCSSLPFGDGLSCTGSTTTPTEHHFTGKERDSESGNDYFGARYYSSAMGRWMSPDPSNLGVDIYLPQTWNRYVYAVNNPLTVADRNGMWPFFIHNEIIDESFPGMSKQDLQGLKDASWNMDFGPGQQNPANSYEHGMSDATTNQNPADARQMADDYISDQVQAAQQAQADWEASGHSGIAPAALTAFGNALHTTTDRTSPAHQGEQPWANKPKYSKETLSHVAREIHANAAQMAAAKKAAQALFNRIFGNQFNWMLTQQIKQPRACVTAGGQTTCDQ